MHDPRGGWGIEPEALLKEPEYPNEGHHGIFFMGSIKGGHHSGPGSIGWRVHAAIEAVARLFVVRALRTTVGLTMQWCP
jgi:hypothetical protein